MSLVKKGKYYYAVIRFNGKQTWRATGCTKEKEAREFHDELKVELRKRAARIKAGLEPAPEPVAAVKIRNALKEYNKLDPSPSDSINRRLPVFLRYAKDKLPTVKTISQLSKRDCMKFLQQYQGNNYNNYKSALAKAWRYLNSVHECGNPWMDLPPRQRNSKQYRALSDKEFAAVFQHAPDWLKSVMLISFYTGLRWKDIVTLQWKSLKNGYEYIELVPAKTKAYNRSVRVYLHSELVALFSNMSRNGQYVFPDLAKVRWSGKMQRGLKQAFEKAKVKDNERGKASFHSLRATFATRAEKHGIPRNKIAGIVGHVSETVTAGYIDNPETTKVITDLPKVELDNVPFDSKRKNHPPTG